MSPRSPAVRVRGVYATALTYALTDADHPVVDASAPIRDRFGDAVNADGTPDVAVDSTPGDLGVAVSGAPSDVETVADVCTDTGIDALPHNATAPHSVVADCEVTAMSGDAAVCDCGSFEGVLPFNTVDGYVDVGDQLRVQVATPRPPWCDSRPELRADILVGPAPVRLVYGADDPQVNADGAAARELTGLLDLVGVEPPDCWALRLDAEAVGRDIDELRAAARVATDRAERVGAALDASVGDPGPVARPLATRFIRFGRVSRFGLDEDRRAVMPTMPGHHRTKAIGRTASDGVDLAEALCGDSLADCEFPFDAVARLFGPHEGDTVTIAHGKPDGRTLSLGDATVTARDADGTVELEREMRSSGTYDGLGTERAPGDVATTTVAEGRWWYPTTYRSADGERRGTYINVCTPVECFPDAVRYVDLHVDVVRRPDGTVTRIDDDELDGAVADGTVPTALAERAREVAASVERAL